jgi:hypothetical protein
MNWGVKFNALSKLPKIEMPVQKGPNCVGDELARFKRGELHSGKGGKIVTDSKQAKAISLSVCGQSKYSEKLQSLGFSADVADEVVAMFAEIDWEKQFQTGKGPGPEKEDNYHTGTPKTVSLGQGMIAKTGVKGNLGKQKVNTESEMLSGVALPKGPANPQGGSSKDVQGLRQLG